MLTSSASNRNLDACLGNYEVHFDEDLGNTVCIYGSFLRVFWCKIAVLIHMTLSSNVPEAFLLYFCFKAIQKQNEKVKELIGENHYIKRKRDNGIVISISIIQWVLEMINVVVYYTYIYFLHGISNYGDKFFSLYLITFAMIIQPSFYLNGDSNFRRNLDKKGIFEALKIALFYN